LGGDGAWRCLLCRGLLCVYHSLSNTCVRFCRLATRVCLFRPLLPGVCLQA
jgi:hypothetical protein